MNDRDFHVELEGVGREMDRRYFFKLLGATGAVLGTVGMTMPGPEVIEVPPVAPPELPPEAELLRARLAYKDATVAETLVPAYRRIEAGDVWWEAVGNDWRIQATDHLKIDDIQIRIPDEIADMLYMPDQYRWRSCWMKDGKAPIVVFPRNDLTVAWNQRLLEFISG